MHSKLYLHVSFLLSKDLYQVQGNMSINIVVYFTLYGPSPRPSRISFPSHSHGRGGGRGGGGGCGHGHGHTVSFLFSKDLYEVYKT